MALALKLLIGRRFFPLRPYRSCAAFSSSSLATLPPPQPPLRVLRSLGKHGALQPPFERDALAFRRLIEERRWDSRLEQSLRASSTPLSDSIAVEVIQTLSEAKLALRFFICIVEQDRVRPSAGTIGILTRRWSHEKQFEAFLGVLHRRNESMTPDTFLMLMRGYGWAGMADKVLDTLETMKNQGVHCSFLHFMCVLNILAREKRADAIPGVYNEMIHRGFHPDMHTYNRLVSELCIAGLKEEGLKLLQEMKEKGLSPNTETYKIVISVFSKANKSEEVLLMVSELLKDGFEPDVKISNDLLKALCLSKKLNEALDILETLLAKGSRPNLVCLTMVFDGLFKGGDIEKAFSLWKRIDKESTPTLTFHDRLVNELCIAGKLTEAEEVFEYIRGKNAFMSNTMYSSLIHGLCSQGNSARASKITLEMSDRVGTLDSETYGILINSLTKDLNVADAVRVFDHMVAHGAKANFAAYHSLLINYCKAGNTEKVQQLVNWMKTICNSLETETYCSVISKFCQHERLVGATEILQEMIELDLIPRDQLVDKLNKFLIIKEGGAAASVPLIEAVHS